MSDLVVVSLECWDDVWRRNQYLVDGLLRTDPDMRVLFVEPPADPVHDARSRRRPETGHGTTAVGDTGRLWTWRPTKWLPRRIDPAFDARFALSIRDAAAGLGFVTPTLWINDPRMASLMTVTGWPTLYDVTDDWAVADRPAAERERILSGERLLLTQAAEVVVCSPELERRKAPQRPAGRNAIVLIPNAVDVDDYRRPRPRPVVLPAGTTAVYAGTLHEDRLDVELIVSTAEGLVGEASVVLVGPNALGRKTTARLGAAGALLTGALDRDTLVGCLQHADVLIMPHLVNAFTDSLDPIKLYEYLAVGRPIVSTAVAGFREAAEQTLDVADPDQFVGLVRTLASQPPAPTSKEEVPSWWERVDDMLQAIRRMGAADA